MKLRWSVKVLSAWLCLLLTVSLVQAQKVDVAMDGARIYKTVEKMASDQYRGRKPNTPEFFELQDWVVKQYEKWGLTPAGDDGSYFQAVPLNRDYAVTYGMPEMVVGGREFFSRYGDFDVDTRSRSSKAVKTGLVFVGYGISAMDKGLDEYDGVDVDGKVVVVLKGDPNDYTAEPDMFSSRADFKEEAAKEKVDFSVESKDSTKIAMAYQKGAAGIILYELNADDDPFARYRRRQNLEASEFVRDFVVVTEIKPEIFRWMFWQNNQMNQSEYDNLLKDIQSDIQNGKSRSFELGMDINLKGYEKVMMRGERFGSNDGRNIIAMLPGTDPKLRHEAVVMGAHFDHVGTRNDQVYNGAEDNASGSAVVMEVARLMMEKKIKPRRSIIFCLWTGEEMGLIGSRYWVDNPTLEGGMDNVVTYFNMDMVGLGTQIGAPGALNFPEIWDVILKNQKEEVLTALNPSTGGPGGSDHSGFITLGIEAMALMTHGPGGHPDYHQTGDDTEKLNAEIMGKTAQFVLQGAVNLANERKVDIKPANRQQRYDALQWNLTVINPELEAENGWKLVDCENADDLVASVGKKFSELQESQGKKLSMREMFRRRWGSRSSVNTGLTPEMFDYNLHLLEIAKSSLSVGRVDVAGPASPWFEGGITDAGKAAVSKLEAMKLLLHLVAPQEDVALAVLNTAKNPLLISGVVSFSDTLLTLVKEKQSVIAVDFDPSSVKNTVKTLNSLKERLGGTDHILINVTGSEGLDKAKEDLYLKLLDEGWEKEAVLAIGGTGSSRGSQGNLAPLVRGRRRLSRRR